MTTTTPPAPAAPTATPLDLAPNLLLARLVGAGKRPPKPADVQKHLGQLLNRTVSAEQLQEWVEQLRDAGLMDRKRMQLTDAGRKQALAFLGTDSLTGKRDWKTIRSRYLVPRALGLDPNAPETNKLLQGKGKDKLAVFLLKQKFHSPVGTPSTVRAVLEAAVCRELGFPDETSLKKVTRTVLNRLLGSDKQLTEKEAEKLTPRILFGAQGGGTDALQDAVLRQWLGTHTSSTPAPEPVQDEPREQAHTPADFDLAAFANTVRAVARHCPTGRFGDNKVFINHVWRRLIEEPGFSGLDLDRFKQKLIEANRADLLTLSRADLVQVMDARDVQESETPYLNAVFHFILIDEEKP